MATQIKVRRLNTNAECLEFDDRLSDIIGAPRFATDLTPWGVEQDFESDPKFFILTVEDSDLAMLIKLALGGWL